MRDTTPAPPHVVESLQTKVGRSHLLRLLTAFLLALVTWGWVMQATDPIERETYAEMDIAVPTISDDLVIVTTMPRARVLIEGPSSQLEDINRSMLAVRIDTSTVTAPGEYSLPLIVDGPADTSARIRTEPETVRVQVDAVATKVMPLQIEQPEDESTTNVVNTVTPSVSQVTVTGPSSAVDRVDAVILPLSIGNESGSFSTTLTPYAVDAQNQVVTEVTILPDQVMTQVDLQSRGKLVSVIADVQGDAADAYVVQRIAVLPTSITVEGPEEALAGLLFVNTEPVDITGASQSISQRVDVVGLPEGVRVVDPADGMVEVRVAIQDSSATLQTLSSLPIAPINVPEGYTVALEPDTVDVTLQGSSSVLSEMTADDITVVVDVNNLTTGTYELTPAVALPDNGVTNSGITPPTIQVTVTPSTATPPSANGTPAATSRPEALPLAYDATMAPQRSRYASVAYVPRRR